MNFGWLGRSAELCAVLVLGMALSGCGGGVSELPAVPAAVSPAGDAPPGSNEDFIVNVGRRVFFTESSAELTDTAKDTLKLQAEWLTKYSGYKIKIEGFTDDPGSTEANLKLGARRADAVKAYLLSEGIKAPRMRTKTFGSSRLVIKCSEASCHSQNRRAVTVLDTEVGS